MQTLYKVEIQQYNTNQSVESNCNVITIVNNGSTAVTVNNFPLAANGGTLQVAGNANEKDTTVYKIVMTANTGNVWVIKKIDKS